ncbi:MAG TPA: 2-succinyl-5-enolpyruvyl-6-hydroxy-3-cyclohexene-1-carboxylic-acid synthase [Acidimicrobiales bacterium]
MTEPEDVQATFAATLVDEWVRGGVEHAVVCPGSRSTPLALAVAARGGPGGRLRVHVHLDERSAGFLALGIGLATGRPAVVVTTSGTAAAELHPAVVEAHQAGVPLLACTTDRPPELRDVGAPQTIDQVHLYGRAVRWFADPGVPDRAAAGTWRALAARALAEATGDHPGPVQLNLPFREPLVGTPEALPSGRPGGRPWAVVAPAGPAATAAVSPEGRVTAGGATAAPDGAADPAAELAGELAPGAVLAAMAGRRGVIVAGPRSGDGEALHRLAAALGWPVLADPRSPAWRPAPTLVPHLDALLRSPRAAEALRPEVIVRLGPPPASRGVTEWLAGSGAEEVVVAGRSWSDPAATAATVVRANPGAALTGDPPPRLAPPPAGWLDAWQAAARAAASALAARLDAPGGGPDGGSPPGGGSSEPAVARQVVAALPHGAELVVSSSMPVRDVERYASPRRGLRISANRGANGIDGVVSTAVGVAVGSGAPTALLIGDLAFLHDSNGLLGAAGRGVDLVCVVVDNDGGGIFSFLPQARLVPSDRFEQLFGTPHGLDLVAVAAALGAEARAVTGDLPGAVRAALDRGGLQVLVVRTDRAANVEVHRQLDRAVADAVDAALRARA